jgi:DNA-binding SARP family transcriptional activator/predicted ATPase
MQHSPPLQIQCFGGFHVQLGEEPIKAFNTDKVRALFIYLVAEFGQKFQRSHLAGLLWSDIPEDQAMHNLRQAISLLRKAIREEDQAIIYADREQVGIQPKANLRVDLLEFSTWMQTAYNHYKNSHGLGTVNIFALKKAIQTYKNPFMDRYQLNVSPLFDEWLLITREKFDTLAVEGLAYLANYYIRRDEKTNAIQMLRRIIHIMPWDESAYYQLIQLLAQDQQWSAAQKQYASLVQYLKNDLNVNPDPKTVALFEEVRAQSLTTPSSEMQRKPLHHLPLMTSQFVGREKEIASISAWIANPTQRLLNILGMGGVGKTRLALEIAHEQVGIFQQGVFVVWLRNIDSLDGFISEIGNVLAINFSDQSSKQQQILDYCRQKHLLLLLDNLDELSTHQDVQLFLEEMIKECVQVKMMVTSRNKINIVDEIVYHLEGLDYEDLNQATGPSDAVQLFTQKVQTIQRKFELSGTNQRSILKLCNLVEGHPLAIELVAGSVVGNIEKKIEETIEQGMGAFISALTSHQNHHQTLSAVFEMSWVRLSPQEQSTLARIAILKGGFEENTVREIFGINSHRLTSLLDKSLLRLSFEGRYDLHEIVRQFSEQKLKESGECGNAVESLSHYYLAFLKVQAQNFEAGEQSACLDCIEVELENIKVAWKWILYTERYSLLIEIIEVLYQYFMVRSRFAQGIEWLQEVKLLVENKPDKKLLYAMLLNRIGYLAYKTRQNELSQQSLATSYDLLQALNNDQEMALCLVGLGQIELRSHKKYQKALDYASRSIQLYQKVQDLSGEAHAAYLKGIVLNRITEYDAAEPALLYALRVARETRNLRRMVSPLNLLGDIACIKGQYDQAEVFFKEGLEIAIKLGDRFNQGVLLNNLATLFHYSKSYDMERKVLLESLSICEEIGDQDGIALAYNNLSEVAMVKGDFEQAIRYGEMGLEIGQQIGEEWTIIVSLNNLGEAYLGFGKMQQAMEHLSNAICMAYEIESLDLVARIAVIIGRVLFKEGKDQEARDWLQASIQHSAIEYDHQQIAIQVLKEHQLEPILEQVDEKLEKIVILYCHHT